MKIFNETSVKQEVKLLQIAILSSALLGIVAVAAFFAAANLKSQKASAAQGVVSFATQVYSSSDPFTSLVDGDTIMVYGEFIMNDYYDTHVDDSVIIIADGIDAEIKLSSGSRMYLGKGSSIILKNGASIQSIGKCDTSSAIYIDSVLIADCEGSMGTSFEDLNDDGGVGPLPVEWLDFSANDLGNAEVKLSWSTAMEINNEYFQVEYSEDAQNWIAGPIVHSKAVGGNSNSILNYSVNHYASTHIKRLYYRVMQVDFDRKFDYSEVQVVNFGGEPQLNIATLGDSKLQLRYNGDQIETADLRVYNAAGQMVLNKSFEDGETISLPSAGVYIVELASGSHVERIKQVVQ